MSCYFATRTYSADSSECFAKSLSVLVLILSVFSDWLNSIKVLRTLTGNRNYFYLRQVRQSGVYTSKVSKSKSIKVTWTKFDQNGFDSVNGLSYLMPPLVFVFFSRLVSWA